MSLFDPSRPTITIAQLQAKIGTETGVSRWFEISQARIDAFAEVTEDRQFIHVDPVAAKATPFGGTVAHGFLTLSMLSAIAYDALPRVEGLAMGVNYGFDKVRFVAPVRAGARIRGRFKLAVADAALADRASGDQRGDGRDRGRRQTGADRTMALALRPGAGSRRLVRNLTWGAADAVADRVGSAWSTISKTQAPISVLHRGISKR